MASLQTSVGEAAARFVCEECGEESASRNALFRHLRLHVEQPTSEVNGATTSATSLRLVRGPGTKSGGRKDHGRRDVAIEVVCRDPEKYRVVVKPQGMETAPDGGVSGYPCLQKQDCLLIPSRWGHHVEGEAAKYKKAKPCHRLDAGTGGLVLCSETKQAERTIRMLFEERRVKKRYRALVVGRLAPETGVIDRALKGKESSTAYKVVQYTESKQWGCITTVDLFPKEGRRHQLRKHLQSVGHPILGDRHYSFASSWPDDGPHSDWPPSQFLWALEMWFPDPSATMLCSRGCPGTKKEPDTALGTDGIEVTANDSETLGGAVSGTVLLQQVVDDVPMVHVCIPEPQLFDRFRQTQSAAAL